VSKLEERVAEIVSECALDGIGFWHSCTGCHETVDGQETGHYPYNPAFHCHLGSGCSECGGIGAVWDTCDYSKIETHAPELMETGNE
jgi:hypothetical protein